MKKLFSTFPNIRDYLEFKNKLIFAPSWGKSGLMFCKSLQVLYKQLVEMLVPTSELLKI